MNAVAFEKHRKAVRNWPARACASVRPRRGTARIPFIKGDDHGVEGNDDYAGLSADQARGSGWTRALHPDDLNGLVDYWQGLLASGKPGEFEARMRRFDGEYHWFLLRATPSFDDNGNLVKWYGTNTDIQARKTAERLLEYRTLACNCF